MFFDSITVTSIVAQAVGRIISFGSQYWFNIFNQYRDNVGYQEILH